MKDNKETLILGAGPAGLAAAFELHKAGRSLTIIEKNREIGGLSRTFQYGGFHTDVGPHRFFSQNQYLYGLIGDLLGDRWRKVNRLTRFYINGRFLRYPIELKNALLQVGILRAAKIILDYFFQRIKKLFLRIHPVSFEEQIISDFGESLARLNMLNYTEKVWGLPCSRISPDWARQRIKGLSLKEVIKNALIKSKSKPKTLVDQFYYPDTGTGLIYEKIKERILSNLATNELVVKTKSFPIKIIHDNTKIVEVCIDNEGKNEFYQPENVISSVPITELVNLLDPCPPDEILEAARHLRFRSHISVFITLNKLEVFKDQWIYFPDKEIPFGRIMEPKNFSLKMSPHGKSSLLIEFFCWENDLIWNSSKEVLIELCMPWLEKLSFINSKEIIESFLHKEKYAYPVYDLEYKEWLGKIKGYLRRLENLQLIGRGGCFMYNNQDHALEMGILSARNIIENKHQDIEEIGAAQVYFEQGYAR